MNEVNELFTKENVEKIYVPDIVKDDLLSIIEEKLKKAGFYYRVAYRVKAPDSMLDKLILKDYRRPGTENQDKKMQDLIGIRIILYYADDVEIVKNFLDTIFSMPGVWNTTEANEYEFRAMKINGIFKLPGYLSKTIVNPELGDYVDDTFEIQVRTNSFEGWHEIEHDMRYKGSAFGTGNEALARKMNSILATLELCDDSVVGLIEDLGHQHYKDRKWNYMLRCHYRLKFTREPLHPYIEEIFDEDTELAKKFYKFKREPLLRQLWDNTGDKGPEITVNNIVKIVNQIGPEDERLKEAFARIEHEKKQETESVAKRRRFEPFKQLGSYMVFKADTYIELSQDMRMYSQIYLRVQKLMLMQSLDIQLIFRMMQKMCIFLKKLHILILRYQQEYGYLKRLYAGKVTDSNSRYLTDMQSRQTDTEIMKMFCSQDLISLERSQTI